jgi:hypothetical protein
MDIDKPGPGRPPGALNKTTRKANEAFDYAFDKIDGAEGLAEWARANRTDFYKLFAKRITVDTSHSGELRLYVHNSLPETALDR